MRTALIALLSSVLLGLTCLPVAAQPNRKPDQAPGAAQMDAAKAAQLRTEIHQTMSALSEAQKASLPDQAKIKELNDNLVALRAQLWAGASQGKQVSGCPWGGNGKGPCGMGMGMGPGPKTGMGRGQGMGMGPGPKAGPNAGMGQGRGRGQGAGMGQGAGCAGCPGCLGCPNCPAGQGCQGQCSNCPLAGSQDQAPPAATQGAGRRGQGRGQGGPR